MSDYVACSYFRTVSKSKEVHYALVIEKARVAPTRVRTTTRLELSATVMATKASDILNKEMQQEGQQEQFWTDSKFVLGYIINNAKRFHVFMANYIQQIKSITESSQWHDVALQDNLIMPLVGYLQGNLWNPTGSQDLVNCGKEKLPRY